MTTILTQEQAEIMADSIAQGLATPTWRTVGGSVASTDSGGFEARSYLVQESTIDERDVPGLRESLVSALAGCAESDAVATCERVISDYLAELAR